MSEWITVRDADAVAALLEMLRAEGWSIGTEQVVAAHEVLVALNAWSGEPPSKERLADWIGPIVCTSPKQQYEFARRLKEALAPATVKRKRRTKWWPLARTIAIKGLLVMGALLSIRFVLNWTAGQLAGGPTNPLGPVEISPLPLLQVVATAALAHPIVTAAFILLPLVIWAVFRFRGVYRLRKILAAADELQEYTPTIAVAPPPGLDFRRIAQRMRTPRHETGTELDVDASVEQAARYGGYFVPVTASRRTTPEYAVFVDQMTTADAQAKLFATIARQLATYGVAVDVFCFDGDPRICWRPGRSDERFRFETIAAAYASHHLLLFSGGERLIDPIEGAPVRWALSFLAAFRDAAIVTPRPVVQWDSHERLLGSTGAVVLPASSAGIAAYVARTTYRRDAATREPLIPRLLEQDEQLWFSPSEPPRELVRRLLHDLELALGRDAMRWLAATAVYPGVEWPVLLHLGSELQIPDFDRNLLALVRLPWFRQSEIPEWLRIRLIATLPAQEEQRVRDILFAMFREDLEERSGQSVRLVHFHDLAKAAPPGSALTDHVLVDFMRGRALEPQHLTIPQRLALRIEEARERRRQATPTAAPEAKKVEAKPILGHPRRLFVLFLAAAGERFAYYGVRALFILYTVDVLALPVGSASRAYGVFAAAIYGLGVIGGWLGDRVSGYFRTTFLGSTMVTAGCVIAGFHGTPSFYTGVSVIALGSSLFRPNVSAMVSDAYGAGDVRRDSGFSIFYMGISFGAILGPIVCGFIQRLVSWSAAFWVAGIGSLLCTALLAWSSRSLQSPAVQRSDKAPGLETPSNAGRESRWHRVVLLTMLFASSVVYWALFEQSGVSLNLFAARNVDSRLFGITLPASSLQAIEPLALFVLAPFIAWFWLMLDRRAAQPTPISKYAYGMYLLAFSFFVLLLPSFGGARITLGWLALCYVLQAISELCISPVGLSTVSKLAPAQRVSTFVSLWYVAIAAGNYSAGWLAGLTESMPFNSLFALSAAIAAATGVALTAVAWRSSLRSSAGDSSLRSE